MRLTNKELKSLKAGFSLSGTVINALVSSVKQLMDVGRYFGSGIRRLFSGKYCSM